MIVPGRGLEPLRISPPDPKSGASANFATLAHSVVAPKIGVVLGFVLEPDPAAEQRQTYTRARPHSTLRSRVVLFCAICSFGIDISQAIVTFLAR